MRLSLTDPYTKLLHEFYMDDKLNREIDSKILPALRSKDEDWVIIIDGGERAGKSTFAVQVGKRVDPSLCLERVCFSPEEFKQAILSANKGECVIFDEAYRGLGSRGALTEVNRIMTSLMMEMGQKNLFIIIVLPSFFLLEKYVALWRARGLFHVYRNKGQKGFWRYYNQKKKKMLYLYGKKDFTYSIRTGFKGRFINYIPIDDAAYRLKKSISLKEGFRTTKDQNYQAHRNKMIYILSKEYKLNQVEITELLNRYEIKISRIAILKILKQFKNY